MKEIRALWIPFFYMIIICAYVLSLSCRLGVGDDDSDDPLGPSLDGAGTEFIFDESLHEEFQVYDWGGAHIDMDSSDDPFNGSICISVAGNDDGMYWGDSICFHRVNQSWTQYYPMSPAKYRNITFYFNHGAATADDTDVSLLLGNQEDGQDFEPVALAGYLPADAQENNWYRVTIPVADLDPQNYTFTQILFYNNGSNNFRYSLDSIFLEWIDDSDAPVISAITESAGYNKIAVSWTTNEPANSTIEYGQSAHTLDQTVASDSYTSDHSLIIPNLTLLTRYYYRITSTDSAGNSTSSDIRAVSTIDIPVTGSLAFSVDSSGGSTPVSPFIYGANGAVNMELDEIPFSYSRMGGNRWTAYNWETNASNAGSDWYFWNDGLIGDGSSVPAGPVIETINTMFAHNAAALVTVPIAGHAASDKDQTNVMDSANHLETRFHESCAFKSEIYSGAAADLDLVPDTTDDYVFQDEFVNLLKHSFPNAETDPRKTIFFDLDNEPALWSSTHLEIHPDPVTYAELIEKNIRYGKAIKTIMPQARVFGFVAYGFNAYINLQDAPDAGSHGRFLDYYLEQMHLAESGFGGNRIIDAIDLHWYPEAYGDTHRITTEYVTPDMVEARIQAPRSLWDTSYRENSWIANYYGGPIYLIPRVKDIIDTSYPNTDLVISEYYYGAGDHISGALAEADVLGIFGREGVFAASLWPSYESEETFIKAAFKMYLNYDGSGSSFGDLSISAQTEDNELSSVYASLDSGNPDRMIIIVINKSDGIIQGDFDLTLTGGSYPLAEIYQINESSAQINTLGSLTLSGDSFQYDLYPFSITLFELSR
ncbi:MAG: hypothetical protein JW874_01115 [Spirochaetales bacterium]|nr:hypothetical protein [Spirochaetales bacterium]